MKAVCIEPCYQDRLIDVGEEVELGDIPILSKHCFTIGGELVSNLDIDESLLKAQPIAGGDAVALKKIAKDLKQLNKDAASIKAENDALKAELEELRKVKGSKGLPEEVPEVIKGDNPETDPVENGDIF